MNCTAQKCECCDDTTYHIQIEPDMVSYDSINGFCLHLTEDEMQQLYFELKEYKCQ
jgi:hypothetical protein